MSIPLHYIYHKIRTKYYFNGECGFICFISLICFYKIEQGGLVHVYCVRQLWNALSNNVSIHVESIQICRWSRCKMHSVIIVSICTFYRIKCHKLDLKKNDVISMTMEPTPIDDKNNRYRCEIAIWMQNDIIPSRHGKLLFQETQTKTEV